jgi:hypothetical protein
MNRDKLIPKMLYNEAHCDTKTKTMAKKHVATLSFTNAVSMNDIRNTAIPEMKSLKARYVI